MLYPNNHCIRMKRILLSKHCYIEYSVKATSFIILVDIKSIWAGPCETVQSKRGVKKRMNMIHCFLFHYCV